MRRFLTALITFSILVMAQNVVAITPATAELGTGEETAMGLVDSTASGLEGAANQPEPISMALLLVGLAGLTAAGDPRGRQQPAAGRA